MNELYRFTKQMIEEENIEGICAVLMGSETYNFVIGVKDGYGNYVHSASSVMNIFYDIQKQNPNLNVGKGVYEAFELVFNKVKGSEFLYNVAEDLYYQIQAEKENKASFKLDNITLLKQLKEHIIKLQKEIRANVLPVESTYYDTLVNRYNEFLEQNQENSKLI